MSTRAKTPFAPACSSSREKLYSLSAPVLRLSRQNDLFLVQHACENVAIDGSIGSAKTTASFATFAEGYLQADFGCLGLSAKATGAEELYRLAVAASRAHDIVEFGPGMGRFNWLDYESKAGGEGMGIIPNLVAITKSCCEVVHRNTNRTEAFWELSRDQALSNLFFIDLMAHGGIDPYRILKMTQSWPQKYEDLENPERFYSLQCLAKAEENTPSEREHELILARDWLTGEMVRLAEKTRSSIQQEISIMFDLFNRYPMREALSGASAWTPDDICEGGKIVICSWDVKRFDLAGKLIQVIAKRCTERAIERRLPRFKQNPDAMRPVALLIDELQFFADSADIQFLSTSRESRAAALWTYHTLPMLIDEFGKDQNKVYALLAHFSTKVCHENRCFMTKKFHADEIGEVLVERWNRGTGESLTRTAGRGSLNESVNTGASEQKDYDLRPRAFTTLARGGKPFKWQVEAIVYMAGRKWRAGGKRWIKMRFFQSCEPYRDKLVPLYPRATLSIFFDRTPTARIWARHVPIWELIKACWREPKRWKAFVERWAAFWLELNEYWRRRI